VRQALGVSFDEFVRRRGPGGEAKLIEDDNGKARSLIHHCLQDVGHLDRPGRARAYAFSITVDTLGVMASLPLGLRWWGPDEGVRRRNVGRRRPSGS